MSRQNDGFIFHPGLLQRLLDFAYRAINFFVRWDRLPTLIGAVNLSVFRDRLRAHNLYHTGYGIRTSGDWSAGKERWRSADGSFNSLDHPRMGMAGSRFGRNFPLPECVAERGDDLLDPNPRVISRELLARRTFIPATTLNLLAAAWIQFETHNWFSHGVPQPGDEFKIPLHPEDDWPEKVDGCMQIRRTVADTTPRETWLGATATFCNANSHWWDAGQIYGSSRARQMQVRSEVDGKIKVDQDGMLPADPERQGADLTGFNDNWWVGLSLLHNLFAREHNVICDALKARYPAWNDEELFQRARLINAALIAKIHTVEWTPGILAHPALNFGMHANWSGVPYRVMRKVLGKKSEAGYGIVGSPTDQHSAPYVLTEEFTSVYRLHPLIPDEMNVRRLDAAGQECCELVEHAGTRLPAVHAGARLRESVIFLRHRSSRRYPPPQLPQLPAPVSEGRDSRCSIWPRSTSCATASAACPATIASASCSARSASRHSRKSPAFPALRTRCARSTKTTSTASISWSDCWRKICRRASASAIPPSASLS